MSQIFFYGPVNQNDDGIILKDWKHEKNGQIRCSFEGFWTFRSFIVYVNVFVKDVSPLFAFSLSIVFCLSVYIWDDTNRVKNQVSECKVAMQRRGVRWHKMFM